MLFIGKIEKINILKSQYNKIYKYTKMNRTGKLACFSLRIADFLPDNWMEWSDFMEKNGEKLKELEEEENRRRNVIITKELNDVGKFLYIFNYVFFRFENLERYLFDLYYNVMKTVSNIDEINNVIPIELFAKHHKETKIYSKEYKLINQLYNLISKVKYTNDHEFNEILKFNRNLLKQFNQLYDEVEMSFSTKLTYDDFEKIIIDFRKQIKGLLYYDLRISLDKLGRMINGCFGKYANEIFVPRNNCEWSYDLRWCCECECYETPYEIHAVETKQKLFDWSYMRECDSY
jgi:hypothetical protein